MKLRVEKSLRIGLLVMAMALLAMGLLPGQASAAPAAPELVSPADHTALTSLRPTVRWNASPGAMTYAADIADNPNFWGPTSSGWTGNLSFTPGSDLNLNSLYFWRVKASDPTGSSDSSDVWHLWTPLTLLSPTNGVTVSSLTPSLDWSDYKTGQNYDPNRSYVVQIANDSGFTSIVTEASATSSVYGVPSGLLSLGQSYFWRVKAACDYGASDWSEAWSFQSPPAPPHSPTLSSPANGATVDTWRPTLVWNPAPGATSYKVHYRKTTSDTWSYGGPFSETSYLLNTYSAEDTTYEWWVEAGNGSGWSGPSATWSLITPSAQTPPAPTLLSPNNGTAAPVSSLLPTFDWTDTSFTNYYKIEIGAHSTPYGVTDLVVSKNVNDSTYALNNADLFYPLLRLEYNTTYYWKVTSYSLRGFNTASGIWSFRTPPPPGPDLVAPGNSATVYTRRPTLTWGAVSGASQYALQVSNDEGFAQKLLDLSLDPALGASYAFTTDLDYDGIYYWRVNFANAIGTSLWSPVWRFRGPPPPVPFAPSLQTPGSVAGVQIVGFRPAFEWTDSTGAASYGFQLATDSEFSSKIVDVSGLLNSSYSLSQNLLPNATHYWRANATNPTGTSEWSSVYRFSTPPPPPAAPILASPTAGTNVADLRPHFDWSDSSSATSYTIEFYTDSTLANLLSTATVTGSEYDPAADLQADATYYWRVRASNEASGTGVWTPAISFKTPTVPPPGTPVLLSPPNGAVLDTLAPTLDWQDDANSSGYRYQIAKSDSFSPVTADGSVTTSEYARPTWASLDRDSLYYWRVRGTNVAGSGAWSEIRSFQTPGIPGTPSLAAPADGAAVGTVSPILAVESVSGATSYRAQLSTASWFPSAITVESPTTEIAVTGALSYGTTYYWRASAKNAAGESGWSNPRSFQTPPPPPPPSAPTLLAPATNSVVGSARPSLDWTDVAEVSKYRLEWSKSPTMAWSEAVRDNLTFSAFTLDVDLLYGTQYYWRVRATGPGGDSPWSTIFGFRTPSGPPALPTLLSPVDGTSAQSPQQKLDWSDGTAVESYRIQIATDSAFAAPLADATTTVSEYTPSTPLAMGSLYYWRVKAVNTVGETDWTSTWSFVVPAPPGAVTLVAPAAESTTTTLRPTLDWEDLAAAASYEVHYSRSDTFGWGVTTKNVTASEYKVETSLSLDADFFWQVRAMNGGGIGPWSELRSFHTPSTPPPATEPPAAPTLVEPADGVGLSNVSPVFSWEAAGGANGYHVQLSKVANFGTLVSNDYTSATTISLANPLEYSTQYFWRIQAVNNIGATNSVSRSFTTPAPPPPPAPALLYPAAISTLDNLSPTFDWADVAYASGYRVQVSAAADFKSYLVNATVTGSSQYALPYWIRLAYGTSYFWRVQSYNNAGAGDWSPDAGFRTSDPPPPPPAPTLTSPGTSGSIPAAIDTLKPTFDWAAAPGASEYRIQLSKNEGFTSLVVNTTTTSNSYSITTTSLVKGTQYWWRVEATNSQGSSGWSLLFTFVTPSVPAAPTLLSPADGGSAAGVRPTLEWAAVPGASKYHITISPNPWFSTKIVDVDLSEGPSYTPVGDLQMGATYYWRVYASSGAGNSGWSAGWRFTVSDSSGTTDPTLTPTPTATPTPTPTVTPGVSLGVPVPLSPGAAGVAPAIDTLKPTYQWEGVAGAGSYRIQMSRNEAFTALAINSTTSSTSFSLDWMTLNKGTQYWWRVQAVNGGTATGWSQVFTFITPSAPAAPATLNPGNGSTVSETRPTLQWNPVPGATKYQLVVGTNSWFGSKLLDTEVTEGPSHTFAADLASGATYYWKVNASNSVGTSGWSEIVSFGVGGSSGPTPTATPTPTPTVTPGVSLGVPVPLSPGAAGVAPAIDTLKPTYQWEGVAGAGSYRIQMSRNEAFTALAINSTTSSTSFSLDWMTLNKGTQYWWRVQAVNGGTATGWSQVFTFITPSAPAAPATLNPGNGSTVSETRPTLQWNPVPGATKYQLVVGTNSWFGSKLLDTEVTEVPSHTFAADLASGATYYWKVNASNSVGTSGWSEIVSFSVGGSSGPTPTPTPAITLAAPVPLSPGVTGDTAPVIGTMGPTYSWSAADGASSYRIQVSKNAAFTSLVVNATTAGTGYTVPWINLTVGTQYWWRVQAISGSVSGAWSAVFTFLTPSKPGAPSLLSPIGGTGAGSPKPLLDWRDVAEATVYHIVIGPNSWFGTKVVDVDVPGDSNFTPGQNLAPGTKYYWKVNASNSAGTGPWSATESFTTPASP